MQKIEFGELIVPLITPFNKGKIDFYSLEKLIEYCIENGADSFVALGTTAETPTITDSERDSIINFILEKSMDKKVIVGAGSNCTATAINLAKRAEELGADGILSVCPYYNKPSKTGIIKHFKQIASNVTIPILLYDVPKRTGIKMQKDVLKNLRNVYNIVGIKQACDTIPELAQTADLCDENFTLYGGNDFFAMQSLELGGKGFISAAANVMPKEFSQIIKLYKYGKKNDANELYKSILPIINALYIESNPIAIKYVLYKKGLIKNSLRLPMCPLSRKNRQFIDKIFKEMT